MVAFYLFGDPIVSLMIGRQYAAFAHFLPKVGLVMLLAAVVNIFVFHFLALRRFFIIATALAGMIFMGFILFRGHSSIDAIINNLIVSLVIVIVSLTFVYAKDHINNSSGS